MGKQLNILNRSALAESKCQLLAGVMIHRNTVVIISHIFLANFIGIVQEFGVDSIFFVVLHDIARKFLPLY